MTRIAILAGLLLGLGTCGGDEARAQAPAIDWFSYAQNADGSWTFGGQVGAQDAAGLTVSIDLEAPQAYDSKDFEQSGYFEVAVAGDGSFSLTVTLDPAQFPAGALATAQVWTAEDDYSEVAEQVTTPSNVSAQAMRIGPTQAIKRGPRPKSSPRSPAASRPARIKGGPAAPRAASSASVVAAEGDLFLESNLTGSGKHGVKWTEGPARAKKENKPQGQFKTQADLDFVLQTANTLGKGNQQVYDLPAKTTAVLHQPDGSNVPAKRVYIKVYASGKVHAFPCTDDYVIQNP